MRIDDANGVGVEETHEGDYARVKAVELRLHLDAHRRRSSSHLVVVARVEEVRLYDVYAFHLLVLVERFLEPDRLGHSVA